MSTSKPDSAGPDLGDEAPELTDEWFQQADLYKGDKLLRRGRPADQDSADSGSSTSP